MIVCPGCGARNDPAARVCDWCARPFVVERHQLPAPWLAPLAIGLTALIAVGTIIAAFVGTRASTGQTVPTPQPTIESAVPTGSAADETVTPTSSSPAPISEQEEFVRIANTGGAGAFLRREPGPSARGVVAHRDGTVLRVVGPTTSVDGRVWQEVEDSQGNRGWTPREFLAPTDRTF